MNDEYLIAMESNQSHLLELIKELES